jgi:hypothetical protein
MNTINFILHGLNAIGSCTHFHRTTNSGCAHIMQFLVALFYCNHNHDAGFITQVDGGYLTPFGAEAEELA